MKKVTLAVVCFVLLTATVINTGWGSEPVWRRYVCTDNNIPTPAVGGVPVISYDQLGDKFSYNATVITEVTFFESGELAVGRSNYGTMPDHCVVKGYMNEHTSAIDGNTYAIGFEMRLPTNWNGRYFYQANGGVDGNIATAVGNLLGGGYALESGCAVISSDAGHPTRSGAFGVDPIARLDYGYKAVGALTPMAKELIKSYYGKGPDKSYIVGSSNGGRHTMVAASRYADMYDGFLAGAPGFNLPKAAVAQLWGVQQYANISDYGDVTDSDGNVLGSRPDISTSFSSDDQALVADAIIAACDECDGVADGMVSDVIGCQEKFNIMTDIPTCESAGDTGCLTYGQKSVLARVHAGAKNSDGESLYSNFYWDPGIRSSGWASWKFGASISNRDPVAVGYIFTTPPQDPTVDLIETNPLSTLDYALNWMGEGFDVDKDAPTIYSTNGTYTESAMDFMTPPDLLMQDLYAKGGKMIVVHGSADPVFSVADTVKWYQSLKERYRNCTDMFARLFIVPGMSHSRGGPSCDQHELFAALIDWVEKGVAPDQVESRVNPASNDVLEDWSADRSRPLCAYPKVPVYVGGDIEDASSFICGDCED